MLGIITLLIALGVQIAFFIYRLVTKSWQYMALRVTQITSFVTFSLLLVSGVYWWGFRWMGLFLLLAILAVLSVVRIIRHRFYRLSHRQFDKLAFRQQEGQRNQ